MLAGIQLTPPMIVAGGSSLLALLVVQILIGYRKIRFQGRTHLVVHKSVAWALLAFALVHVTIGLTYLGIFG